MYCEITECSIRVYVLLECFVKSGNMCVHCKFVGCSIRVCVLLEFLLIGIHGEAGIKRTKVIVTPT